MKKRFMALAMAGVMAMSLAACGSSDEAAATTAATTAAPAATEAPAEGDTTEAPETEAPAAEAVDLDLSRIHISGKNAVFIHNCINRTADSGGRR